MLSYCITKLTSSCLINYDTLYNCRGIRYRSWLRHCTTSQKVMGSIPDISGFFNWPIPSSSALPQPLTEMSSRNLPGDKVWLACKTDIFTAICEPVVYKMWEPQHLTTLWASTASYKDSFTFFYVTVSYNIWIPYKNHTLEYLTTKVM
jgi:hypothetical protein